MTPLEFIQIVGVLTVMITAATAWLKSRPEAGKISAETDLIRVQEQAEVIDSLMDELHRGQAYIQRIKKE